MQRLVLGVILVGFVVGCGPSLEADHVKTPDELIAEEEAKGEEHLRNQRNSADYDSASAGETEEDKRRGWDEKQADLEMRRAARSAESCPDAITEKVEKGRASVALTFANDGHVKNATISAPYTEDSAIGKCVLRAMKAVIVPAYQGAQQTVNWEVDLTGEKKSGPAGGAVAGSTEK